jgi:thiol-disulfide isomerase/thioredoxin
MRKLLFILFVSVLCTGVQAADNGVLRIKGKLEGIGDKMIVTMMENARSGKTDTIALKNGKINCAIPLSQPVTLYIRSAQPAGRRSSIRLAGVPGETLELNGTMTDYTIGGSKFYKQYAEMDAAVKPFKGENARAQRAEAIIAFAKQHPDYEATAAFLESIDPRQWDDYLASLAPSVRDGRMKPLYQPLYDMIKMQMQRRERAAKLQAEGLQVADFTLEDINGQPLSLSSLRGKYVVLDFWGSWCGWCIKGFPEMKKYYEKYKDKMEILGVDCNDTPEKWKKAVADHQLPWLHVYNKKGEGDITQQFGITGYPTKIIIDPQGRIARSIIGESSAFYTYLDELFK